MSGWDYKYIFGIDATDGKVLVAVHAETRERAERTAIVHALFAKRVRK